MTYSTDIAASVQREIFAEHFIAYFSDFNISTAEQEQLSQDLRPLFFLDSKDEAIALQALIVAAKQRFGDFSSLDFQNPNFNESDIDQTDLSMQGCLEFIQLAQVLGDRPTQALVARAEFAETFVSRCCNDESLRQQYPLAVLKIFAAYCDQSGDLALLALIPEAVDFFNTEGIDYYRSNNDRLGLRRIADLNYLVRQGLAIVPITQPGSQELSDAAIFYHEELSGEAIRFFYYMQHTDKHRCTDCASTEIKPQPENPLKPDNDSKTLVAAAKE